MISWPAAKQMRCVKRSMATTSPSWTRAATASRIDVTLLIGAHLTITSHSSGCTAAANGTGHQSCHICGRPQKGRRTGPISTSCERMAPALLWREVVHLGSRKARLDQLPAHNVGILGSDPHSDDKDCLHLYALCRTSDHAPFHKSGPSTSTKQLVAPLARA